MQRGIWCAVGAYVTWGLFPIYWKWLQSVPYLQLLGHRILWSCLALLGIVTLSGQGAQLRESIRSVRVILVYLAAALLIALNWLIYVWAVNAGHVIESSLGYFINPLVSVLLGVVILRERLRPGQWLAVAVAASGVLYLILVHGSVPAIALTLAVSFGLYGLVKKIAPLGALHGLTLETGLLLLPAVGYLLLAERRGDGAFLHRDAATDGLLVGAGLVTTLPLLLFGTAARRIPLSLVGILQYIAPTLQFLLGKMVYREPFAPAQLVGFSLVWTALLVFGVEGLLLRREATATGSRDLADT